MTPKERYFSDLPNVTIERLTDSEIGHYFYQSVKRRVNNDATISVNGELYEVPFKYIGQVIEVRFPTDAPTNLTLYENDAPVCELKKLNVHENAQPPIWGIRFRKEE